MVKDFKLSKFWNILLINCSKSQDAITTTQQITIYKTMRRKHEYSTFWMMQCRLRQNNLILIRWICYLWNTKLRNCLNHKQVGIMTFKYNIVILYFNHITWLFQMNVSHWRQQSDVNKWRQPTFLSIYDDHCSVCATP